MISNRHIGTIAIGIMSVVLVCCILAVGYADSLLAWAERSGNNMEYVQKLFGTDSVMDVQILMDEDEWQTMLKNATREEYYECDVVVNGKTFYRVGIRPKGNTSLSSIASNPDSDRYSFKLEFDQFIKEQTCYGLDKLVLNNNYADATNMKEAVIYDMFQFLGADAPLYQYAKISVNGEYWGVYLALEAVEDSFLLRNYGTTKGNLYKPDGMNFGGGGMFGRGGGANLNYTDDALSSYSTIWAGAVTDSDDEDHQRLIASLKKVHTETSVEKYLDVDNVLKYMAVHNFSVNKDSLSGSMAHNYYLYENNGKLNILPWDYNLSFGGMNGGGASSVVNAPIDEPYAATDFFDILLEKDAYRKRYHEYYNVLVEEYCNERFDSIYNGFRADIDNLVATDPNALYTYEQYDAAANMLYDIVLLRAESVRGQLDNKIPSTSEAQKSSSWLLVDASAIDLSVMGTFMGGGRR